MLVFLKSGVLHFVEERCSISLCYIRIHTYS
jgi:hypothetical protein